MLPILSAMSALAGPVDVAALAAPVADRPSYEVGLLVEGVTGRPNYSDQEYVMKGVGLRLKASDRVVLGGDGHWFHGGHGGQALVDVNLVGRGLGGLFVGASAGVRNGRVTPRDAPIEVDRSYRVDIPYAAARVGVRALWHPGLLSEVALFGGPNHPQGPALGATGYTAGVSFGGGWAVGRGPLPEVDKTAQRRTFTGLGIVVGGALIVGAAALTVGAAGAVYRQSQQPASWGFGGG